MGELGVASLEAGINRLHVNSTDDSRKKVGSLIDFHKVSVTKRNWGDAVGSLEEFHKANATKKNWRDAVIVVKFSVFLPWRNISLGLSRLLKVHHDISPLAADRAVI